jgi:hypothetical protein
MARKVKGKVAEREVAKLIGPWWATIEPDSVFVRTPMSGGWGDDEVKSEFKTTGDLMTTSHTWPFDVEVKRREGWSEEQLFIGAPSPVWNWWQQTQRGARISQRQPMLWLRHNRRPWMVLLSRTFVDRLFYGYKFDSVPSTICTHCLKPCAQCACKVTRYGSGTLGAPLHEWGTELMAVNYGVAWPVAFLADELLAVHPTRFIIGSPQAPHRTPEACLKCGGELMHVRGALKHRRCARRCGWTWDSDNVPPAW